MGWDSDFHARAKAARKIWEAQKARKELTRLRSEAALIALDADEAVDIGEGCGVDVRHMIKALQAKDVTARAEQAHRGAQRIARALLDGSEVMEPSTGAVIVRQRTHLAVTVPGGQKRNG